MLAQTDYAHQMTDQKKQILMGTSMKKVSSVFAETAKLIFVPTNQTFSGQSEIHRALEKDSKLNDLLQEKVLNFN
jgi:pentose-5-phosphate-3-epimerase